MSRPRVADAPGRYVPPADEPPVAYCYAPGTSDEVIRQQQQKQSADPQMYFNASSRWSGDMGSPRALTWSFVPDGLVIESGKTSELFSRMDALFASAGGRAVWIAQFQAAFDRWAALSGTSYTRVRSGAADWDDGAAFGSSRSATRGDVRICMIPMDGQWNVLAKNYFPSHGDMVMDSSENWANPASNYRFLRNVLMHEHGHGLGLYHVCPVTQTKLMEPYLSMLFDGPQHDDIRGCQRLYGDDAGDSGTLATSVPLGSLLPGSPLTIGEVPAPAVPDAAVLSIDADGESDLFQFTMAAPGGLDCTVAPVGLTYDSSVQNSDGSCSSGSYVNSLALADLNVQVLGSDGVTVLATGAARPAGEPETLANVPLPAPGSYYVRVFEGNTPAGPQLYTVSLSVSAADCNRNGVPDAAETAGGAGDCNRNGVPDVCEPAAAADSDADGIADLCESARGDFDLDGDVDQDDFGHLQTCLAGQAAQAVPACQDAHLAGAATIGQDDLAIFRQCATRAGVPYDPACNGR